MTAAGAASASGGRPPSPPFWSIMVPTWEPDPGRLMATLESVRASGLDPADHELVIVDDASRSTAAERALAGALAAGVEVRRHGERAGLGGNWNRCIAQARGAWVHVLHQDDRVRPGFYAALRAGIDAVPQLGAAFCQVMFIDAEGRELRLGDEKQTRAGILDNWVESVVVSLTIQCAGIVVRRSVYERLGCFDTSFAYAADVEMWSRIVAEYPVWFEPRPLAEYRVHPSSTTSRLRRGSVRWRERERVLESALALLSPAVVGDVRASWRHYTVRALLSEARESWRQGDWRSLLGTAGNLLRTIRPVDARTILRGKLPRPIVSRAPARAAEVRCPRLPRILVVSEHFPAEPARAPFGGVQRVQRHVEALSECAVVDALFIWPDGRAVGVVERLQRRAALVRHWPIAGDLRFLAGDLTSRLGLADLYWALRGTVGFMYGPPTLRTCRSAQARRLRSLLAELQPDLILAHGHGAMAALIRVNRRLPPTIMDFPDLEQTRTARNVVREIGSRRTLRGMVLTWLARHTERAMARRADLALVCSDHDKRVLARLAPSARIAVVPNTARPGTPPPPSRDPVAVFIGIGFYPPNAEAIRWLVHQVWPRVRALHAAARLLVAGEGTQDIAASDPARGIDVRGYVADVMEVYAPARVALAPIHSGSGTRIKIIEAAMLRRPVVSTTIGAEGLTFQAGEEILIADAPAAFARHVADLLDDGERCAAIAAAAYRRAMASYAPERVRSTLVAEAMRLLGAPGQASPREATFTHRPAAAERVETGGGE